MIEQFEKLTKEEAALLMKAPALVSLLAASISNKISIKDKADAIKLAHVKTFTADPMLIKYYEEVELNFIATFEEIEKQYEPFDDTKRASLKNEIQTVNRVISKLDRKFGLTLQLSLTRYAGHVRKAERSVLEDFIFPFILPGLTD